MINEIITKCILNIAFLCSLSSCFSYHSIERLDKPVLYDDEPMAGFAHVLELGRRDAAVVFDTVFCQEDTIVIVGQVHDALFHDEIVPTTIYLLEQQPSGVYTVVRPLGFVDIANGTFNVALPKHLKETLIGFDPIGYKSKVFVINTNKRRRTGFLFLK